MGKLRRRFADFWSSWDRNIWTGHDVDRAEPTEIVLANDDQLPFLKQNVNALNLVQQYSLGCRLQVGNRVWRYAHMLAAGAPGRRGRAAVMTDPGLNRATNLGAIVAGVYTVNWTVVGANLTADQLRNGYILMQGGFVHKISHNTAGAIASVIVLTLYEPFQAIEALPAGRYGMLLENPYANVNAYGPAPGSVTGRVMGMFMAETVVNTYTWIQTWGPGGVLLTGALGDINTESVITMNIAFSDQMLNHVGVVGADGLQVIGECFSGGGTDTWDNENFGCVWLKIDP